MEACGLVVEYNPFHNGHLYHVQKAKEVSGADCIIAVMSGTFLQRGEPAIIDKFHRTESALANGVDIVVELPFPYAVQSSRLFATGSVKTLNAIGVSTICFGSESGNVDDFTEGWHLLETHLTDYERLLSYHLNEGEAFPEASSKAYEKIGLDTGSFDLTKPNNILGFSYVRAIMDNQLPITPLTIKRAKSDYHDPSIATAISSATSIRKALLESGMITPSAADTMPEATVKELENYREKSGVWHVLDTYFHLLHYRVMTMLPAEIRMFQGVDEGLEHRIKKTARSVSSMEEWLTALKTKRYTWTRLQRIFIHLLTNTTKQKMQTAIAGDRIPYVRLLGMNETGRKYVRQQKKHMDVPLIHSIANVNDPMLAMEEAASRAYYSILSPSIQRDLFQSEFQPVMH